MAKTKNKKEEIVPIGKKIKFEDLFRVKGKQGLWALRSKVNSAGLCGVLKFDDFETVSTVKAMDMICLGQLVFTTYAGNKNLGMVEAFNNLEKHIAATKDFDFEKADRKELLPVIIPEFDEDKFKEYHVEWVLMWYKIITKRYNQLEALEKLEKSEKPKDVKKNKK